MSKLPTHITYIVGQIDGRERSLCVEASSLIRIEAFRRRAASAREVVVAFGLTHQGLPLPESIHRSLKRGLYRHAHRTGLRRRSCDESMPHVRGVIEEACLRFGISESEILNSLTRKAIVKQARWYVVRMLRNRLNLSITCIGKAVRLKNTSQVNYWLSFKYDSEDSKRKQRRDCTKEEFL